MTKNHLDTRIVFLIGGVLSGIGKGTTTAAFAHIFKNAGLKVSCMKHDPYLNWSAGKIDAEEHGEVFVTTGGHLTDLDLASYERFLEQEMPNQASITLGQTFHDLISAEKAGQFNGKTVDLSAIPRQLEQHIDQLIAQEKPDVLFVEVGGNVADKNVSFILETINAMQRKYPRQNIATIFITYLIYFADSKEYKVRAAHHSIKRLQSYLIDPDIVLFRTHSSAPTSAAEIAAKCQILPEQTFVIEDVNNLFALPSLINQKKACEALALRLQLNTTEMKKHTAPHFAAWKRKVIAMNELAQQPPAAKIAVCHQYPKFAVNYSSQKSALEFSSQFLDQNIELVSIDVNTLATNPTEQAKLKACSGIFISTGLHTRGFEGKVFAANYARTHQIPLLATGFGMFPSLVEYARNVLNLDVAPIADQPNQLLMEIPQITEFIDAKTKIEVHYTGTKPIKIAPKLSFAQRALALASAKKAAQKFEGRFNTWIKVADSLVDHLHKTKLQPVAFTTDAHKIPTMFELKDHPFFVLLANHHEFTAWPNRPSFVYTEFLQACLKWSLSSKN